MLVRKAFYREELRHIYHKANKNRWKNNHDAFKTAIVFQVRDIFCLFILWKNYPNLGQYDDDKKNPIDYKTKLHGGLSNLN